MLTEIATWDDRLLAQQFKDLSLLGLDFSIEITGFDMGEIDLRIASLDEISDQADDPADALPEFTTRAAAQPDRGFMDARSPSAVVRQRSRWARNVPRSPSPTRPQRAHRRSHERPRRGPSPAIPDGLGRDGQGRIHCLSRQGFPQPRGIQRRRLAALHFHGLAPCRRAVGRWPRRLWRAQTSASGSSTTQTKGVAILACLFYARGSRAGQREPRAEPTMSASTMPCSPRLDETTTSVP
jgi:hypothetical protein